MYIFLFKRKKLLVIVVMMILKNQIYLFQKIQISIITLKKISAFKIFDIIYYNFIIRNKLILK